jgi:hypothetical protein
MPGTRHKARWWEKAIVSLVMCVTWLAVALTVLSTLTQRLHSSGWLVAFAVITVAAAYAVGELVSLLLGIRIGWNIWRDPG